MLSPLIFTFCYGFVLAFIQKIFICWNLNLKISEINTFSDLVPEETVFYIGATADSCER